MIVRLVFGVFRKLIYHEANPDADYESTVEFGEMFASNFRRFCKPLGINDLSAPAIEENYIKLLKKLTDHFDAYPYFLGHRLGKFLCRPYQNECI